MKQHITVEQLNELSEKSRKNLIKRFKFRKGDWICWSHLKGFTGPELLNIEPAVNFENIYECYPLLSIGQMIEFLDDNDAYAFGKYLTGTNCRSWQVKKVKVKQAISQRANLCDALWQAVKEILNK